MCKHDVPESTFTLSKYSETLVIVVATCDSQWLLQSQLIFCSRLTSKYHEISLFLLLFNHCALIIFQQIL